MAEGMYVRWTLHCLPPPRLLDFLVEVPPPPPPPPGAIPWPPFAPNNISNRTSDSRFHCSQYSQWRCRCPCPWGCCGKKPVSSGPATCEQQTGLYWTHQKPKAFIFITWSNYDWASPCSECPTTCAKTGSPVERMNITRVPGGNMVVLSSSISVKVSKMSCHECKGCKW